MITKALMIVIHHGSPLTSRSITVLSLPPVAKGLGPRQSDADRLRALLLFGQRLASGVYLVSREARDWCRSSEPGRDRRRGSRAAPHRLSPARSRRPDAGNRAPRPARRPAPRK